MNICKLAARSMLTILPMLALGACKTAAPEGREVPPKLRAKAADFNQKKAYCARIASTDEGYAECLGVKWETLKHDQTGLHEDRNAKGELQ